MDLDIDLDIDLGIIAFGCLGGLIPDLLRLAKNRHRGRFPEHINTLSFWVGLLALVLVGGLASFFAQSQDIRQALAYGFSGPEILSRLVSVKSHENRSGTSAISIRAILSWWAK